MDNVRILIKGAILVTPQQKKYHLKKRDLLLVNGQIKKIASKLDEKVDREIRLSNLHLSAGWFELGAGFGEPGHEDRETLSAGQHLAALSGFTQLVLLPDTAPVPDNRSAIRFFNDASKAGLTKIHPLGSLTVNREGKELAELYDMQQAGAVGFFDSGRSIESPSLLKIALQYSQSFGGTVFSLPIDSDLKGKGVVNEGKVSTQLGLKGIPVLAETTRITRDLHILAYSGGRLHIPGVSSAEGVKLIEQAKKQGLEVSCSTSLHHLIETDKSLEEFDTQFKVLPPLRTEKDRKALLKALAKGTIDYVQSDHSPRTPEEKQVEFDLAAYGTIALESVFGQLQREYDLEETIEILTRGYQFVSQETPKIEEGEPVNLSLFNPETNYTLQADQIESKSKNSLYVGKEHKGWSYGSILGDQMVLRETPPKN